MKNNHIESSTSLLDVSISGLAKEIGELEAALKEVPYIPEDTVKGHVGKYYSYDMEEHVSYISINLNQRHRGDFENLEYKILLYAHLPKEEITGVKKLARLEITDQHILDESENNNGHKYLVGHDLKINIIPLRRANTSYLMIKGTIQEVKKLTKIVERYVDKTSKRTMHDAEHPGLRETYGKHRNA